MWQLSRIPCVHATKVMFLIYRVPKSYVPAWFETDMYFVAYHNFVKPALGMIFLPDQSMYSNVLLLKPKMPSMPRKKRIRAIGDGGSLTRVTKVGMKVLVGLKEVLVGLKARGGVGGSRRGAFGSKGGASGSRGGASVYRRGVGVSRGVIGGYKDW
ncbi:hypothetical protein Tco_0264706 [Tanacetum coccineum]